MSRFGYKNNNWSIVYFIQGVNGGPIKIGHTDNIEKRIKQMQTGNPNQLILLHITRGGKNLEDQIHEEFKEDHYRGEWFKPSKRILEFIESTKMRDLLNPKVMSIVEFAIATGEPLTTNSKHTLEHMAQGVKVGNDPYWDRYKSILIYYNDYLDSPSTFLEKYGKHMNIKTF